MSTGKNDVTLSDEDAPALGSDWLDVCGRAG